MTTRAHGLMILVGSAAVGAACYWLLFPVLSPGLRKILTYPLALPLVGMLIGLLELSTGVPIKDLEQSWQRLPALLKVAIAIVGGVLVLWGFLWVVSRVLGA